MIRYGDVFGFQFQRGDGHVGMPGFVDVSSYDGNGAGCLMRAKDLTRSTNRTIDGSARHFYRTLDLNIYEAWIATARVRM